MSHQDGKIESRPSSSLLGIEVIEADWVPRNLLGVFVNKKLWEGYVTNPVTGQQIPVKETDEIFVDNVTGEVHVVPKERQYQPKYLGVITNVEPKKEYVNHFEHVVQDIIDMHRKKAKDYTSSEREFGNFEDSAKHAGITTAQAIENLIGTKEARRQNLENGTTKDPINESLEDTLLDRAVYCIIRLAHYRSLKEVNLSAQKQLEGMQNVYKP